MPTEILAPDRVVVRPIILSRLCLDFEFRAERFLKRFRRFLEMNRKPLELGDSPDPVAAYVRQVWPDGLPGSVIVANTSTDEFGRWLLRPPVAGPRSSTFAVNGKAPAFRAYRKQTRLVVDGFELVPHVQPRSFEAQVSAQVHINPFEVGMDRDDFTRLEALPRYREHAEDRLHLWREYLDWREKLIHIGQVALRYERREITADGRIHFSILSKHNPGHLKHQLRAAAMLVAPLGASRAHDLWDPPTGKWQRLVRVGSVVKVAASNGSPTPRFDRQGERRPSESSDATGRTSVLVAVQPDEDESDATSQSVPEEGFLLSSISGDMKPLHAERRGTKRLRNGQGHNRYLPAWISDVRLAGLPDAALSRPLDEDVLAPLDDDQRAAVTKAMAAPDVVCLQGPPGTGKTTVIAALCDLITSADGRVLVVSQTNLAVDNALCRLPSKTHVLPIRVGLARRVEEECRVFLEEEAPKHWLRRIQHACRERLQQWERLDQQVRAAGERFSTLRQLVRQASELRSRLAECTARIAELRVDRTSCAEAHRSAKERAERSDRRYGAMNELAEWAHTPRVDPPAAELLADTPAAEQLSKVASQLHVAVRRTRWKLPWLSRSPHRSLRDSIAAVQRARKVIEDTSNLELAVREAISLCIRGGDVSTSNSAQRLQALQEERRRLVDSESEDDLVRVAAINREINRLRDDHWAAVCRVIQERLRAAFDGQLPTELDDLTASLRPRPSWRKTLERLLDFTTQLTQRFGSVLGESTDGLAEAAIAGAAQLAKEAHTHWAQAAAEDERLCHLDTQMEEDREQLEDTQRKLHECEHHWSERWSDVCPDLDEPTDPPAMSADVLRVREEAFKAWNKQESDQWDHRRRWLPILQEWVHRLDDRAAMERQDLQELYVKYANVVGCTCTEAGQRYFYDHEGFEPFDVTIIDEVSRATPVELLLAMLLARKIILVGDHRQLPPMFREHESSYADAVEEGLIAAEDFERFKRLVTTSFFQELFEAAPDSLRHSLTRQYRMHPQIMLVDNQFYDGQLVAGGAEGELAKQRQHHLTIDDARGGRLLEPHQHVLWIDSTKDARGRFVREEQRGSSKANRLEVELVAATLVRLNRALAKRGYGPTRNAVAMKTEAGVPLRDWIKSLLRGAALETINELFESRRIMLNGRHAQPDELIQTGDKLELDARKPVGVITFYGAQLAEIRRRITRIQTGKADALEAIELRTNTVDRFQGMERPIVLASLVRALPHLRGGEFVRDYHRINVALSRAQELLVIIGSEKTFRNTVVDLPTLEGGGDRQVPVYRNIFEIVKRYGGRRYANQLLCP